MIKKRIVKWAHGSFYDRPAHVTSSIGYRRGGFHCGVDAVPEGVTEPNRYEVKSPLDPSHLVRVGLRKLGSCKPSMSLEYMFDNISIVLIFGHVTPKLWTRLMLLFSFNSSSLIAIFARADINVGFTHVENTNSSLVNQLREWVSGGSISNQTHGTSLCRSTGFHSHVEMFINGYAVNPESFINDLNFRVKDMNKVRPSRYFRSYLRRHKLSKSIRRRCHVKDRTVVDVPIIAGRGLFDDRFLNWFLDRSLDETATRRVS
jgi:hypothetical protein